MKRVQQGFTLIELMIVVAIVGILAAVAIPAYRDYTIRSKVSEVAAALGACKTSVAEYHATKGTFPGDATAAGCSTTATQYLGGLSVANTGAVTGTVASSTGATPANCTMQLTPSTTTDGITAWTGTSSCLAKFVPATFR